MESKETRIVWITMLAMKDAEGKVLAARKALAHRARVSEEECEEALRVLMSEDPESSSKVDGGRRVKEIEGGWQIINHDVYRFSTEAKREFWRQQKREQRASEGAEEMADAEAAQEGQWRRKRVMAKIAREEAIEAEVRAKFNHGATGERIGSETDEVGLSAREIIKKRVEEDPITKADKETMKKRWGGGKGKKATKVEEEYDIQKEEQ